MLYPHSRRTPWWLTCSAKNRYTSMVCLYYQSRQGRPAAGVERAPRRCFRRNRATRARVSFRSGREVQAHNEFKVVSRHVRDAALGGIAMYAVIRAGGKQYRVAPGDIIEVEKLSQGGGETVEFSDVLAVSRREGELGNPANVLLTGEVVEQGRGDKVMVFHYKRKKQYKKLNGHRQPYTAVKITGINVDGKELKA